MSPRTLVARIDDAWSVSCRRRPGCGRSSIPKPGCQRPTVSRSALHCPCSRSPSPTAQARGRCSGISTICFQKKGSEHFWPRMPASTSPTHFPAGLVWRRIRGSLTLLPPTRHQQRPVLHPLTDAALSERIRQLPRAHSPVRVKRMSWRRTAQAGGGTPGRRTFRARGRLRIRTHSQTRPSRSGLSALRRQRVVCHAAREAWGWRCRRCIGAMFPSRIPGRALRPVEDSPGGPSGTAAWIDAAVVGLDRSFKMPRAASSAAARPHVSQPGGGTTRLLNWLPSTCSRQQRRASQEPELSRRPCGHQLAPHYDM